MSGLNIVISCLGSLGDVHPFVGLGLSLQRRGHSVTVITNEVFGPLIRNSGLGFIQLGTAEDYRAAIEDPDLWYTRRAFKTLARRGIIPMMKPLFDIVSLFDPGDTVVVASTLCIGARIAQEKQGFRLATAHLSPAIFRSVYETPVMDASRPLPGWAPRQLRAFLYLLIDAFLVDRLCAREINEFRAGLGLSRTRHLFGGWVHSPDLVIGLFPDWFAQPQPDWPSQTRLTGFLFFDAAELEKPVTEAMEFLDQGDAPIVFTPGSPTVNATEFFQAAIEACQRMGMRGILLTRHRSQVPRSLPDSVRHFDYLPFSKILGKASALVHHGGIGTVAQALRAGIPQLLAPMIMDQPDNAARVQKLGVGSFLTPDKFRGLAVARELERLLVDPHISDHCVKWAQKIATSESKEETCLLIERLAGLEP
jgi:rhamnosyltransferase subunit B